MASTEIRTYLVSLDAAFAAGQRAVRDLGYKIDSIDRSNGLLNFKTGMSWSSWAGQEMSMMFVDNADGSIEVSISGRRNQSGVVLQVYDWGESKKLARKVLAKMDRFVETTTEAPPSITAQAVAPPPTLTRDERECPHCAELILKKARVCKHCGRDVADTQTIDEPGHVPFEMHQSDPRPPAAAVPPLSDIAVTCTCGARLKAKRKLMGKTVPCPKCKKPLKINISN